MFNRIGELLQRAMGGASQRHEAIAHNVANANTPNYQRRDVDFLTSLKREMRQLPAPSFHRTHPGHQVVKFNTSRSGISDTHPMRNDGNTVDVESEMVHMAQNTLYFNSVARQWQANLARLRTAITEGRR